MEKSKELGEATITPSDPVKAGSFGCWKLLYRVGECGIKVGGGIVVDTDSDTDWGELQFHDSKSQNYTTVTTTSKANLSTVLDGRFRLKLKVYEHPLVEGDEICIVIGETSFGSPGSRAQTFAEEKLYFRIHVDSEGNGLYVELPKPPYLQIVGTSAERLSIIAPSQVVVGDFFSITVRVLDKYGNPSHQYTGKISFEQEKASFGLPENVSFKVGDRGVRKLDGLTARKIGMYSITLKDDAGLVGMSNPIKCLSQPQDYRLFWGDLHGQVMLAEKIRHYFRFARDVSALDFASHQRNDHEVSKEHWEETKQVVKEFNHPGEFVAYLGFEWSGQHEVGGDHNIYFLDDDQPIRRSGHEIVADKSDVDTDLTHIKDVYKEYRGKKILIIPHVGGRPANLNFHDPSLEPVIEVHSTHGTFEWFLKDALKRNYRVGFVAGSDDYKLRQGGAYPGIGDRRFVRGGLMAVYAKGLTRDSLYEALKARRCYGTTGERIILETYADNHMMGEEYTTDSPPEIVVKVAGTKNLESVELFRGLNKIYEHTLRDSRKYSKTVKITWGGASREWPYSGVMWTGEIRVKDGKIKKLDFMPLDRGDEVFEVTEDGFKWTTFTCGDQDGASFQVEDEDAEITLTCVCRPNVGVYGVGGKFRICVPSHQVERIHLRCNIKELRMKSKVFDVGSVGRRILIRRLSEGTSPREIEFKFVDESFEEGVNPYWVRVVQSDGEMAWSSPIYVKTSRIE